MDENTLFLLDAAPNWQDALNDLNQSGQAFVVAPIRNDYYRLNGNAKLLVFRDSAHQLQGVFMIYLPDEAYRLRTNGNYNAATFTGIVVYTNVNGQAFLSYRVVNGQIERLYNATINRRRNAVFRNCLEMAFPSCQYVFDWCGNITFCDCSGNCGFTGGSVFGPTGNNAGSTGRGFSYGNPPTTSSGGGNIGSSGGGGGGAWNSSQPASLFTLSQKEALRIKYRTAGLDEIFYTLEQHDNLLAAANLFLDSKGWDNLNKPALERLVNSTGEYAALAEYLTALCVYPDFYNANVASNFPISTFTAFATYHKAGFTTEEFLELYANADLFKNAAPYLIGNNFDADSKDYIRNILKNLKDAKDIATSTSSFCSKQDLYDYVKNSSTICPNCNEGQLQDKIGTMFENAFNDWQLAYNVGNYEPNTNDAFRRFSPSRNADVAPDGFMKSIRHPTLGQLGVDQKAHWVECKASNKNVLGLADYTGQIKGEIEALAEYQPWACANHMAAISYVTTIDMVPSPKLIDYANARGIWILQSYASFEIRSDGKMYLTFASVYPHRTQFGEPFPIPTMAALKQSLTSNYVEFK